MPRWKTQKRFISFMASEPAEGLCTVQIHFVVAPDLLVCWTSAFAAVYMFTFCCLSILRLQNLCHLFPVWDATNNHWWLFDIWVFTLKVLLNCSVTFVVCSRLQTWLRNLVLLLIWFMIYDNTLHTQHRNIGIHAPVLIWFPISIADFTFSFLDKFIIGD